ncbi:unnamed protein product, partial [marine sediment metagenome]
PEKISKFSESDTTIKVTTIDRVVEELKLTRLDMTFRKGVFKLPMSHLFYVLGRKDS